MLNTLKKSLVLALAVLAIGGAPAHASVLMTGTRVIFPADLKEKTLQFTNADDHPNVVQVWLDTGSPDSTIDTADAPFIANPQIFRVEPRAGQMVRLIYTGANLPQDRETVFYLNFTQAPAIKASSQDANKLVLMFSSRLKVFYRPKGLAGSPADLTSQLRFRLADGQLQVDNPTGYHAVVRQASLWVGGKSIPLAESAMIAPKSSAHWNTGRAAGTLGQARLRITLVNDYGVDVVTEVPLH